MSSVDKRVVQMSFDNAAFERNAKQSMSTIDKLKQSLNFKGATKGLQEIEEQTSSFSLNGIARNVETITDKVSYKASIFKRVLENLTDSAMQFGGKLISNVIEPIQSGGLKRASSIEHARFTLQGLISDEKEVEAILADAKESVNETAFTFDDAASAAASFAATGLRSGEEMQSTLRGIAGIAATAGSDYSEIAHIFTTMAGNGRVMTEQLNQFSYRQMNAAATLRNAFNDVLNGSSTLSEEMQQHIRDMVVYGMEEIEDFGGSLEQVSERDIRTLVSKGAMDFRTFSAIMAETFGDHAKDANKTFDGAMANIRAALSRTGAMFYEQLIVQEGPLVQLFNSLMQAINNFNAVLKPLAIFTTDFINNIVREVTKLIDLFVSNGGIAAFGPIIEFIVYALSQAWNILQEVIFGIEGANFSDVVIGAATAFREWAQSLMITGDQWTAFRLIVASVKNVVDGLIGAFSFLFEIVSNLATFIIDVLSSTTLVDTLYEVTLLIADMGGALRDIKIEGGPVSSFLKDGLVTALNLVFSAIRFVVSIIRNLGDGFKELSKPTGILSDVMTILGDAFSIVIEYVKEFMRRISGRVDGSGILGFLKSFTDKITDLFHLDEAVASVKNFVHNIKEQTERGEFPLLDALAGGLQKLKDFATEYGPEIWSILKSISDSIIKFVGPIATQIWEFVQSIGGSIFGFRDDMATASKDLSKSFEDSGGIFDWFKGVLSGFKENIDEILPNVKTTFDNFIAGIKSFFDEAEKSDNSDRLVAFMGLIGAVVVIKKVKDLYSDLTGKLKELKEGKKAAEDVPGFLQEMKDAILNTFEGIQNKLKADMLVAIAIAIGILAGSLWAISQIPSEKMLGSLMAIDVLARVLRKMMEVMKTVKTDAKTMVGAAILMFVTAAAVNKLTDAVEKLGALDPEQALQGLIAVSILIKGLSEVLKTAGLGPVAYSTAAAMIAIAFAILMLTIPVIILSGMNWGWVSGLLAVVLMMGALCMVLEAAKGATTGSAAAIASLMALAGALILMMIPILVLSMIPWDKFGEGLLKTVILIGVLVLAIAALSMVQVQGIGTAATLIALSLALILFSAALFIIAQIPWQSIIIGAIALAAAIAVLALVSTILAPAAAALTAFGIALLSIGAGIFLAVLGFSLFVITMAALAPAVLAGILALTALIDPLIVAVTDFIKALGDSLQEHSVEIWEAVGSLLLGILKLLLDWIPVLVNFIQNELLPELGAAVSGLLDWLVTTIENEAPKIFEQGKKMLGGFIDGLLDSLGELLKVPLRWLDSIIEGITGKKSNLAESGGDVIDEFINGLKDGWHKLLDAGADFVAGLGEGIWNGLKSVGQWGADVGAAAWNGLTGFLGISSPSKLAITAGEFFVEGFGLGIDGAKQVAEKSSIALAESTMDAFNSSLDSNYNPVITPVVDLSNVQNGINTMDNLMGTIPTTYGIDATLDNKHDLNARMLEIMGSPQDYAKIIQSIGDLRSDLEKYTSEMAQMKVYLDTGTMVGELTPGIDKQLGRNTMMAGRRVRSVS